MSKFFDCYFNYGYSHILGKDDEHFVCMCEKCYCEFLEDELEDLRDYRAKPAEREYAGEKKKCFGCEIVMPETEAKT